MCITLKSYHSEPNTSLVCSKKYLLLGAEYFSGLGSFNIEKYIVMCITLRAHHSQPNTSLVYNKKYLLLGAEYISGLGSFNIEKCYVHNIFTILSQQVISHKLSFLSPVAINNNLLFKICCKNIVDIASLLNIFFFWGLFCLFKHDVKLNQWPPAQHNKTAIIYLFIFLETNGILLENCQSQVTNGRRELGSPLAQNISSYLW